MPARKSSGKRRTNDRFEPDRISMRRLLLIGALVFALYSLVDVHQNIESTHPPASPPPHVTEQPIEPLDRTSPHEVNRGEDIRPEMLSNTRHDTEPLDTHRALQTPPPRIAHLAANPVEDSAIRVDMENPRVPEIVTQVAPHDTRPPPMLRASYPNTVSGGGGGGMKKTPTKIRSASERLKASDWQVGRMDSMREETLISDGRPATSDVRGNLGPPSVVTSNNVDDWLKDRWQAAKNMKGHPIPGSHFIEIDLERTCDVTRALVDWETAHARNYELVGWLGHGPESSSSSSGEWLTLFDAATDVDSIGVQKSKQHVVHEFRTRPVAQGGVSKIRLNIRRPATKWGSSIWRLNVWGVC